MVEGELRSALEATGKSLAGEVGRYRNLLALVEDLSAMFLSAGQEQAQAVIRRAPVPSGQIPEPE